MQADLETRQATLRASLTQVESAIIALSGGVDSALLAKVCHTVLGDKAAAATIVSPMLAQCDLEDAKAVAKAIGITHILVQADRIEPEVSRNAKDRCYHCKREELGAIVRLARERGFQVVMDGCNADDRHDYRPGARAAREIGVISPLKMAGFSKADVRAVAQALGLRVWDKPSNACLASRVPYGEGITAAKLRRIERAEAYLHSLGFRGVRVRCHNRLARIEVRACDRERFREAATMDAVSQKLKTCGFLYVCLDLDGYSTGSLNREILAEGAS